MTEEINTTKKILGKLERIVLQMRQNQDNAITEVGEILPELVRIFQELFRMAEAQITEIPEIPVDILIQQLENFEQFYQQQDIVQLADTLEYELQESIRFYIEILKNME